MVEAMNRRRRPRLLGLLLVLLFCCWASAVAASIASMSGGHGPNDGASSRQTFASSALAFASPLFGTTDNSHGATRASSHGRQQHRVARGGGSTSSSVAICRTALKTRLQSNLWNDFWSNLQNRGSSTSRTSSNSKGQKRTKQQQQLIDELLALTSQSETPFSVIKQQQRVAIDAAIANLAAVSPISATAMALQLQQTWQLLWTTEKEINLFVQQGWTSSSTSITQTIARGGNDDNDNENSMNDDGGATVLTNNIPLDKIDGGRGSFSVTGRLYRQQTGNDDGADNADSPVRTRFEFQSVQLNLGKWGTYSLPPVGKGWFDTVYLDDTFRVDVNSRNDILICQAAE